MKSLQQTRCLNHELREAVARCPQCRQFFCRECIVEHEDRLLCASCLRSLTQPAAARRSWVPPLGGLSQVLLGFLLAWFCFYSAGRNLIKLGPQFHEGTIWQKKWWEE